MWKINIFEQTLFCDIWRAYCNQQYGWFLIALAPRLNKQRMHFSIANIWQYFRHVLCSIWLKSQSIEVNVKNYSNHLRVYFCSSDRDVLHQQFSFWNDSVSPYSAQQLPVLPCALINIHVICFVGSAILYVSCLYTLLTQKYNITPNTRLLVGTVVRHLNLLSLSQKDTTLSQMWWFSPVSSFCFFD